MSGRGGRHSWPTAVDERRDFDRRLDQAAREAAEVIKSADDPHYTVSRFLILLGDSLQTRRPAKLDV